VRVFLGAFGQPGHAFPMLALGRGLVARGHQVKFETWSRWRDDVEQAGMEFAAAPEYPVFPTREHPLKPYEAVARATPPTRAAIAEYGADVVVHDILTLAPALGGELEGLPVATLIPHVYPVVESGSPPYSIGARAARTAAGRMLWRSFDGLVDKGLRIGRDELNETRRRLGLAPTQRLHGGLSEQLVLVGTLPQLEYPREWPDPVHVVGPLMWEQPFDPVPIPAGEGPLVLVAPSTAQDPHHQMLRTVLPGLAGTSVRVLATTNRRPLPAPVRLAPGQLLVNWLSYTKTMPQVDAVICHAGHGTLVRALACGVPVLAVPHSGDMGENAARLDWSGAGVRLPWRLLSPRTVRLAVGRLLDPRSEFRVRAGEFARWAQDHDGADHAAELVERLAG
jgi:UDP:flavonoid glycosyltransferase YjiC (YdhE family)